jgi:hypothetical protein
MGKDFRGFVELDQLSNVKKGGPIRNAARLIIALDL